MRQKHPIPQAFSEFLQPVKQFVEKDPIEKEELISRIAGRVEQPVLNFLKRFSFVEMSKAGDELIVV